MIIFEEELRKFHPSPEVDEVQAAITNHDMSDMTDLLMAMLTMPVASEVPVEEEQEEM